ncbi:unnamed protein product [Ceutorhynchus assimilis]|uniref:UPF3 domain-containing protein n=1 Tax=Ceutorhynchus assimilis TaxID=467358 RepID=A0A9N9QKP8_9CUCU|nr:unnamed protein product [Ceutorhynchus assimilis]
MTLTDANKRPDKKEKPFTKVIIRRLPPTMTLVQFLEQASPVPDYNYIYHVKGDMSLGENAFSRVYINFVCPEDVYGFNEKFDNYVFVDNKGHEYTAVVEFAAFQKIPKKRGKLRMDPKCNSIEEDTYYLEFVASLNKPVEQEAKPEYTLQLNERGDDKNKDITTPLLEFIKNKRAQKQKIREVRREEREKRKKEYENKKYGKYYDENHYEDKSPTKLYGKKPIKLPKNESPREQIKSEPSEEKLNKSPREKKDDKQPPENKSKDKKPEEKKERKEIKPRFPKKEYTEVSREYNKRDDYSHRDFRPKHYDEYKKEDTKTPTKTYPKKIKKYSEMREERKIEAQKAVLKKIEEEAKATNSTPIEVEKKADSNEKSKFTDKLKSASEETVKQASTSSEKELDIDDTKEEKQYAETNEASSSKRVTSSSEKEFNFDDKQKEKDYLDKNEASSSNSRRIRNKDRPTIPLYRPGMLSKRKQPEAEESSSKVETKTDMKKE